MTGGPIDWQALEDRDPELAATGYALLCSGGGHPIGFFGTVSAAGIPHLAPVCPFLCDGELCVSVAAASPKRRDLDANGRYVLHAFLGASDAEFRLHGKAVRVDDAADRQRIIAAIPFAAFSRDDPVYRLRIAGVMYSYWENPGTPETRRIRAANLSFGINRA